MLKPLVARRFPGGVARLSRRQALLALGGGVLAAAGCGDSRRRSSVTATEVPLGGDALSLNVIPVGGRFETLQRDAIRVLAPPWVRVTLGLVSDVQAGKPYVRLAPNALGLVADFQLGSLDAATWPDLLEATLQRYPEIQRAELLNEPERVNGLSADRYVQDFLRPGYEKIRERFPGVAVVAAAPVGDKKQGPSRFRRLTDAGADDYCDYRAVHVYFEDDRALSRIAGSTRRPILVTETGTKVPGQHVRWYTDVIPRIRAVLGAELVFWYVLLQSAAAAGGTVSYSFSGSSLISGTPNAAGQPQAASGSGLYALLAGIRAARSR